MPKPLFSQLAGVKISKRGDIVTITTTNKRRSTKIPVGVIMSALIIRATLSYVSQHHVPGRVVYDSKKRFVCYVLYPTKPFNTRADGLFGEEQYLRSVGFQQDKFVDMRATLYERLSYTDRSIKGWVWKTLPHRRARNLKWRSTKFST